MSCILFSRPWHDGTLSYLYYYSKELIEFSKSNRHKTINREKEQANKKEIINLIEKQKPDFIMFNGHGSPNIIAGHKNEIIISKENPEVLSNAIIYSLTCSSAQKLGKLVVTKGAICFIGYDDDFNLGKDPNKEASPRKDKIAKLFLEPSNILVKSLIEGLNVKKSVEKAKEKMEENIWYLSTTKEFPEAQFYAPFLFGNYKSLVTHGENKVSISNLPSL